MPDAAPTGQARFEDRGLRLVLFGGLAMIVGALCFGLALIQLALPRIARAAGMTDLPADKHLQIMGATVWVLLGLAFSWAGFGALRKRRWVRPVMLTLAWSWLMGGALTLLLLPQAIEAALWDSGESWPGGSAQVIEALLLGLGALGFVVLPAAFLWAFHDRNLLRTLEAADPVPTWAEACPPSVLGLSLGLAGCAVLALPLALRPAVPVFGHVVTGGFAVFLHLVGAVVCAWLARATYRLEPAGWWGTTLLSSGLSISFLWTLLEVPPDEWYRALGYSREEVALVGGMFEGPLAVWTSVAISVAGLAYLGSIRKHFTRASR